MRFGRLPVGVLLLAVVSVAVFGGVSVVWAQQNGASTVISSAQTTLVQCFDAAKAAELAGANITSLTTALNSAGLQLSNAELAQSSGNVGLASSLASQSQSSLSGFLSSAAALKSSGEASTSQQTLIFVASIVGTFVVIGAGAAVWVLLKRKYGSELQKVTLRQYKVIFIVVIAVVALFVASPALGRVSISPQNQFFTELSLLGPAHMAQDYPYNLTTGQSYNVFLDVGNQLGSAAYYQIEVKFRNESQSAPDIFNATSSSQPSLYNLNAFVANKQTLEIPVTFSFDYSQQSAALTVNFNSLTFNGETLNLAGYSTTWDSTSNVFYGNLIFELWIYNSTVGSFQYNDRSVGLIFNMTA